MRARVLRKKKPALSLSVRSDTDNRGSVRFAMTCARMGGISWMGSLMRPLTDALMRELSAIRRVRELDSLAVMSVEGVARVVEHAESRFHKEPLDRA